mmetsp:Transcript_58869/g.108724  ORF Transcript_58869/g.108724 Transcript_58869/m.108724 type:complete len:253 (+) Transcript_58869:133-891(+)
MKEGSSCQWNQDVPLGIWEDELQADGTSSYEQAPCCYEEAKSCSAFGEHMQEGLGAPCFLEFKAGKLHYSSSAEAAALSKAPAWSGGSLTGSHPTPKGARLASEINVRQLTTLQCYGLSRSATLPDFVRALNEEGLCGQYNFASVPRSLNGEGEGYAFVNFTSSQAAALLAAKWHGVPSGHACFEKRPFIRAATRQGYDAYVTTRRRRQYDRVHCQSLWPLIMTRDGSDVVFGTSEASNAAMQHCSVIRLYL